MHTTSDASFCCVNFWEPGRPHQEDSVGEARFVSSPIVTALRGKVSLLSMGITPTIQLASFGFENSLVLMVLALVVFGPRRLPQIGRQIGKIMYEFRKASNDFKYQMEEELRSAEESDRRKKEEERLRQLALNAPSQPALEAQVTQINPGALGDLVGSASPYPGEEVYPPIVPDGQFPDPAPMIQPPSIGEQVAAARPGAAAVPAAEQAAGDSVPDATGASDAEPATAVQEAPAAENASASKDGASTPGASEQVTHGG